MKTNQQILNCKNIARQKRLKALKKIEGVLLNQDLYNGSLTMDKLYKVSGVSRAWIYRQEGLQKIFTGKRSREELLNLLNAWLNWEKSFLE